MTTGRTHNLQYLKGYRRELRKHSTVAEMFLWNKLKGRQVEGLLFRRQFSVDNYILDFYCPELQLAIELDGEVHNQQIDYDKERSNDLLDQHNIKVLRYENHWVFDHLQIILKDIHEAKVNNQKLNSTSSPPKLGGVPRRGEGVCKKSSADTGLCGWS